MKLLLTIILCFGVAALAVKAEECVPICTEIYAPLCGEDKSGGKKVFASKCTFDLENCVNPGSYKFLHLGEC